MIVQYLIDWKHIRQCIDKAANDVAYAERLLGRLVNLREAVEANGILIMDETSEVLDPLNDSITFVDGLAAVEENDQTPTYGDLVSELQNDLNLYYNRVRIVTTDDKQFRDNESFIKCVQAWCKHLGRISQGRPKDKSFVIISDKMFGNQEFVDESRCVFITIDSYKNSEAEELRRRWHGTLFFTRKNEHAFFDYLNAFAASAIGDIVFSDQYIMKLAAGELDDTNTDKLERQTSLQLFLTPFLSNSYVDSLTLISSYPKAPQHNPPRDSICFSSAALCNVINGILLKCKSMKIYVLLLQEKEGIDRQEEQPSLHPRTIAADYFAMGLEHGIDVFTKDGRIKETFRIYHLPNWDDKRDLKDNKEKIRRCDLSNCCTRRFKGDDIDMEEPPYEKMIRTTPPVKLIFIQ